MALIQCPECRERISEHALACPRCGNPMKPVAQVPSMNRIFWFGYEWKSRKELFGWPLVHIAIGRDRATGRILVAKGIIAVGQFGIGVFTIAQFGIGLLFGFGQFIGGPIAVAQFALGLFLGLGQFATGVTAIGQIAFGKYVLAQAGFGKYVWSVKVKDPEAIEYFMGLWYSVKRFLGW